MSLTFGGFGNSKAVHLGDQPYTPEHEWQLLTKLQTLDSDFRTVHLKLIDLINEANTEALDAEQERLREGG